MSTHVFVSDIHLGLGNAWDWSRPDDKAALVEWLEWLELRGDVKDLVLLGDSLDNWIHPPGSAPPSIGEILQADSNAAVAGALRRLMGAGIGLYIVRGNHDIGLSQMDVERHLKGAWWCSYRWHTRAPFVYAEHGHMKSLFNAPDPAGRRPPFGYWISRALTRSGPQAAGDMLDVVAGCADDVLEAAFTSQSLTTSIWEAVCEQAGLEPDDTIVAPWGRPMACRWVGERYASLIDEWWRLLSWGAMWRRLKADCGDQAGQAEHLTRQHGWRCVVMGHSHKALLDKQSGSIYCNAGSWSRGAARTWVEIARDGARLTARLQRWADGVAITQALERI